MKLISLVLGKILAVVVTNVSTLWAAIEFILYLVKDNPFNWTPVWIAGIGLFVAMVLFVIASVWQHNTQKENELKRESLRKEMNKKSIFQQRLEAKKERESN